MVRINKQRGEHRDILKFFSKDDGFIVIYQDRIEKVGPDEER